uniref:Ig-like domain-containing protein n=2 Tax=Lutzomyia longipalpis TaxID=7200 RepID=A0A1B0CIL1_LUTLO
MGGWCTPQHAQLTCERVMKTTMEQFEMEKHAKSFLKLRSTGRMATQCTYVLAWKRGIAILTAGTVKVTPDPRVRLVNGYTLQIKEAVPQDAGDYICQIATLDPREITHHVEILSNALTFGSWRTCVNYFIPHIPNTIPLSPFVTITKHYDV